MKEDSIFRQANNQKYSEPLMSPGATSAINSQAQLLEHLDSSVPPLPENSQHHMQLTKSLTYRRNLIQKQVNKNKTYL